LAKVFLCGWWQEAWQKITGQVQKGNTSFVARQTKSFPDFWQEISLIIPQRHTNQGKKPFVDRTNRKVAMRTFTPAMFQCADCSDSERAVNCRTPPPPPPLSLLGFVFLCWAGFVFIENLCVVANAN
jgi:hypothetical protein